MDNDKKNEDVILLESDNTFCMCFLEDYEAIKKAEKKDDRKIGWAWNRPEFIRFVRQ